MSVSIYTPNPMQLSRLLSCLSDLPGFILNELRRCIAISFSFDDLYEHIPFNNKKQITLQKFVFTTVNN